MEFIHEENRVYIKDEQGELLAEITFPKETDHVCIDHTWVSEKLQGQGIASKLVQEVLKQCKAENLKIRATCSYAKTWFEKHPKEQTGTYRMLVYCF